MTMTMRATLLMSCGLLMATPTFAGTRDTLIGLDEKITYDANGQVNGPPGKDAVVILDVSNPAKPRIRGSLPLMNSLLGPPPICKSRPTASWAWSRTRW